MVSPPTSGLIHPTSVRADSFIVEIERHRVVDRVSNMVNDLEKRDVVAYCHIIGFLARNLP